LRSQQPSSKHCRPFCTALFAPLSGNQFWKSLYLVFPKSGNGKPRPLAEVLNEAGHRFDEWGGQDKLVQLLKQIA
jgi:hypothetical protein